MYIKNLLATSIPSFQCGSVLANYLMRNGLPLLSQSDEGKKFYFADTQTLRDFLENAPLWVKILQNINNGFSF